MRALILLIALCGCSTLHAADLAEADLAKPPCPGSEVREAASGERASGAEGRGAGDAGAGARSGVETRNRMTPRWHSMLPGMFR